MEARSSPSRSLISTLEARSDEENGEDSARPRVLWARRRVFGGTTERSGCQIPNSSVNLPFHAQGKAQYER